MTERLSDAEALRLVDGAAWLLDSLDSGLGAIWGEASDGQVLWSKGEPLMIYGPTGAGKSTIVQQAILGRIGVRPDSLFGLPLAPSDHSLYLALDRPRQIKRSLLRMVSEDDRELLREHLTFAEGPLSFNFDDVDGGQRLVEMCLAVKADTLVVDSLKDAAVALEKPDVAARVVRTIQYVIQADIDVAIIHHPRKSQGIGKPKLDDVFGGTWLTAICGSVVLIDGDAGDSLVTLEHLKPALEIVGPFKLHHDHQTGTTTFQVTSDVLDLVRSRNGITARTAAAVLLEKDQPSANEVARFRTQLQRLVKKSLVTERPGTKGGKDGGTQAIYFARSDEHSDEHGSLA